MPCTAMLWDSTAPFQFTSTKINKVKQPLISLSDSSLPEDKTATETLDTNMKRSASVSVDSLYSSVQTKPQGSGGAAHQLNEKLFRI